MLKTSHEWGSSSPTRIIRLLVAAVAPVVVVAAVEAVDVDVAAADAAATKLRLNALQKRDGHVPSLFL